MIRHPFVLSRKILKSVEDGIRCIKLGTFTETEIKALLIDLREVAKYMRDRLSSDTNYFTTQNRNFIEVCDFIAHASRDRGLIEGNVRRHVRRLHESLESSTIEDFQRIPVDGVLNANQMVLSLVAIAYFCLSSTDKSIGIDYFREVQERQSEIALCIISLLQDSFIELKEEEGYAALQLYPYNGLYRVYCRVLKSKMEREAQVRTGGKGRIVLGFPVVIGAAACTAAEELDVADNEFPFPIFETYRDSELTLKLRRLAS